MGQIHIVRCTSCGRSFEDLNPDGRCPSCGLYNLEVSEVISAGMRAGLPTPAAKPTPVGKVIFCIIQCSIGAAVFSCSCIVWAIRGEMTGDNSLAGGVLGTLAGIPIILSGALVFFSTRLSWTLGAIGYSVAGTVLLSALTSGVPKAATSPIDVTILALFAAPLVLAGVIASIVLRLFVLEKLRSLVSPSLALAALTLFFLPWAVVLGGCRKDRDEDLHPVATQSGFEAAIGIYTRLAGKANDPDAPRNMDMMPTLFVYAGLLLLGTVLGFLIPHDTLRCCATTLCCVAALSILVMLTRLPFPLFDLVEKEDARLAQTQQDVRLFAEYSSTQELSMSMLIAAGVASITEWTTGIVVAYWRRQTAQQDGPRANKVREGTDIF